MVARSRLGRGLAVLTMASVIGSTPLAARAQHVVTEDEAGKLTLEALTAAPRPVYRPIYHAAFYRSSMIARYERRSHGWQRAVSRVSYRVAVTHHVRHRR